MEGAKLLWAELTFMCKYIHWRDNQDELKLGCFYRWMSTCGLYGLWVNNVLWNINNVYKLHKSLFIFKKWEKWADMGSLTKRGGETGGRVESAQLFRTWTLRHLLGAQREHCVGFVLSHLPSPKYSQTERAGLSLDHTKEVRFIRSVKTVFWTVQTFRPITGRWGRIS